MTNQNNRRIDAVAMSQMDDATLTRWAALEPVLTPLETELILRWNDYLEIHAAGVEAVETYTENFSEIEKAFDIADLFDRDEEEADAARRALKFVRDQEGFDAPIGELLKLWGRLLNEEPVRTGNVVLMPAEEYDRLMEKLSRLDSEFFEAIK